MKRVSLSKIRRDGGTQTRATLDLDVIDDYAEQMEAGAKFPPVTVFYDGSEYWLADGFHRVGGAEKCGREHIECDVKQGTQRDAILYSVGANCTQGLKRTNEDKRRAVMLLLNDEEWAKKPDNWIARQCGVSQPFVASLRKDSSSNGYKMREVQRNGKTYTQNTANIGKRTKDDEAEADIESGRVKEFESAQDYQEHIEEQASPIVRLSENQVIKEEDNLVDDAVEHLAQARSAIEKCAKKYGLSSSSKRRIRDAMKELLDAAKGRTAA